MRGLILLPILGNLPGKIDVGIDCPILSNQLELYGTRKAVSEKPEDDQFF